MKNLSLILALVLSTPLFADYSCYEMANSPYRGSTQRYMSVEDMDSYFEMAIWNEDNYDNPNSVSEMWLEEKPGEDIFRNIEGTKQTLYINLKEGNSEDGFIAQLYGTNSLESSYWRCYEGDSLNRYIDSASGAIVLLL